MRLLIFLALVGCGTGHQADEDTNLRREVTISYFVGSETVSIMSCVVSDDSIVETSQTVEMSTEELAAVGAVCDGSVCSISDNYTTKERMCGNQEIYRGAIRRQTFKEFYPPF